MFYSKTFSKMLKRKNILILRHMELLERTRLGISGFHDFLTNDSGSLWLTAVNFLEFSRLVNVNEFI